MVKGKMSRSFIPIAEEYMKSGMFDEAIAVLKPGFLWERPILRRV